MSPAEILRAAKAKIEDPAHWCTNFVAVDRNGSPTANVADGCRWCAIGSVAAVLHLRASDLPIGEGPMGYLYSAADQFFGGRGVASVNDDLGHKQVMHLFDRAIELAEADSQ